MTYIQIVRRVALVCAHLPLIVLSSYLALALRFDGSIPAAEMAAWLRVLPWLVTIRGLIFVPFRLYGGLWRYTGIWDLQNILAGVTASTIVMYGVISTILQIDGYPRSIFIIDAVLLVFFIGGVRLLMRLLPQLRRPKVSWQVLIVGAGDAGELVARELRRHSERRAIGFIDDDVTKVGRWINGVQVLGTRKDLALVVKKLAPDEVLIAVPGAEVDLLRDVVAALQPFKVAITRLPSEHEMSAPGVRHHQARSLSIEDLLSRAPVGLDMTEVRALIAGRSVLVTGAGGSIGSELCRQIAGYEPSALILLDRYENGLYAVANELAERSLPVPLTTVVGDITDQQRLEMVVSAHRPHLIFHAAAHKHVPLMEGNACEAVKNNVVGTRLLLEVAERFAIERVVLISTDKAVNPTSVMGCTKRVCELLLQRFSERGDTRFVTVRFGNVLGSNGSVLPRFASQIKAGGPVTVTHADIRRYFMMIPEAVLLVLKAAAVGRGGELFVLDMGEQVRILDLARNLISLSGFVPEQDIPIVFTGLRPGEKLYEELATAGEKLKPSSVDKIMCVHRQSNVVPALLTYQIWELEQAAFRGDSGAVIQLLTEIVPTFAPGADTPKSETLGRQNRRRRPVFVRRRTSDGEGLDYVQIVADRRRSTVQDRRRMSRGGRREYDHQAAERESAVLADEARASRVSA